VKYRYWFTLLISLGVVLLTSNVGNTHSSFTDGENSSGNAFTAFTSTLWNQTTQVDFNAGVLSNVDIATSPGDVKLAVKSDWYNTAWSRRIPITINNPGSGLSDYQVKVQVTYDSDMQVYFDDIRFTTVNGITLLSYWRESFTASVSAVFWVKVPSVPTGNSTVYMYYGNATVSSNSDGNATFDFFDDFSKDLSKWNIHVKSDIYINEKEGNPGPCLEIGGGVMDYPYGLGIIGSDASYNKFQDGIIEADIYPDTEALPEIIFRGNYDKNTGYKGRWDCREDYEPPFFTPPYEGWEPIGDDVLRFGIANKWQTAKLVIIKSTFEIYSNGILMSKVDDETFSEPGEIGLANHYGAYARFDNVRVRKYASPEPATGSGLEEKMYISSGTIASQVLDTGTVAASQDALFWDRTIPVGTTITFDVRASDTLFTKSDSSPAWTSVGGTSPVTSGLPLGRYKQWRANLATSDSSNTSVLHEIRVYYH
jgi:hypothetical protein